MRAHGGQSCVRMKKRLKVLVSAYSCAPFRGSEHEVGWQWTTRLARDFDVTVLTRRKHRKAIELGLAGLPLNWARPKFVYHEASRPIFWLHRRFKMTRIYYIAWQRSAWEIVAGMCEKNKYDLLHHIAFAGFRYRTAVWQHGVPCIWGPIGGMESIPMGLLPWKHPQELAAEIGRNMANWLMAAGFHALSYRASLSNIILVANKETEHAFKQLGITTHLMPTIGLDPAEVPKAGPRPMHPKHPLRLVFIGKVILLKGIDLAIEALKKSGTEARLTVVGAGAFLPRARTMVRKMGLANRVEFLGNIPRAEIWGILKNHDILILPTLHDSGSFTILEAMGSARPVICLDCGGPALSVASGCGTKIPCTNHKEVVEGLARAIWDYNHDRRKINQEGRKARKQVLAQYSWDAKVKQMGAFYKSVARLNGKGGGGHKQQKIIIYSILIVVGVSLLGWLSLKKATSSAAYISNISIPSVAMISLANSNMDKALVITLGGVRGGIDAQRMREGDELCEKTGALLASYAQTRILNQDESKYLALVATREDYLEVRKQVCDLVAQHKLAAAQEIIDSKLLPAFSEYKRRAEAELDSSIQAAREISDESRKNSARAQLSVVFVAIGFAVAGFIMGFFK